MLSHPHVEAFADLQRVVGDYAAIPSAQIASVRPLLLLAETAVTIGDAATARSACTLLLEILSDGTSARAPYRDLETSPIGQALDLAKHLLADAGR